MASGGVSPTNPGALLRIDTTSGAGVLIQRSVTPGGLTGLGFDSTGRLFGTSIDGPLGDRTSALAQIDPLTGGLISSVPILDSTTAISIGDLAVQPGTDVLFGIRSNADAGGPGGQLYTIDPSTGAATLVGDTFVRRGGGLAFAPDGSLYFLEFGELHQLNPLLGSILGTTSLDFTNHDGLTIHPDGTFFAPGSGDDIRIINPLAGTSTLLGATGAGYVSDLVFFDIPVPGTLFLVGLGIGVMGIRTRLERESRAKLHRGKRVETSSPGSPIGLPWEC